MSNIYQNNFNNCMKMRLSNSDYWDLFLCNDCTDEQDNEQILSDCILVDIDINNKNSFSGDTLYSLTYWTGSTVNSSGVTLYDIGLTGIDNGFITLPCSADTSGNTFLNTFTGSTLFLPSGDTRFSMKRVTGCTYDYSVDIVSGITEGNFLKLCGGFYQGFFKLSDRTFFIPKDDNKFTWSPSDFCMVDPLSGNTLSGISYDYQVLPTRYEKGWTTEFWIKKEDFICTGVTATTLNDVYPNNSGMFFYMGTRSENKFWDVFSGETGYTTSSGIDLSPPSVTATTLNNNPFIVYNGSNLTTGCTFTGITKTVTRERDRNEDIVENALGFRIKSDGSIGYRYLTVTGECSGNTYITGATIIEEYSESGIIIEDYWSHIVLRYTAYNSLNECELLNEGRRLGRLDVYVNGYLKFTVNNFKEFLFKDLNEHREKQQGVPFNYSLGGGTQGLIETKTINGPDIKDNNLIIQENFAGTFKGYIGMFKMYGCSLDVTTIRQSFKNNAERFGLVDGEIIYIDDVAIEIDFYAIFHSGSIVIQYIAETKQPVVDDIKFDFCNEVGVISGDTIVIEDTIHIPKGETSGSTIVTLNDDYSRLSDDYVISVFNYTTKRKTSIKKKDIVIYTEPVKSMTADIPNEAPPFYSEFVSEPVSKQIEDDTTPVDGGGTGGRNPNQGEVPKIDKYRYYYGKSTKIGLEESDITNLIDNYKIEVVNSHIELPEGNGYGFILIPSNMKQPSMFRNSEEGCNGFAIPMIYQGDIGIGEIDNEIFYKMYRTYVPTYAKVDIWLCD